MKLIAHRGNIDGINSEVENHPDQIKKCIEHGYDVEIDLRFDELTRELWLGHDEPQYKISWYFLAEHVHNLWIHCKDIVTLYEFSANRSGYNYFWHQNDDYTLTSQNYIWTYPGKSYTSRSVIVMPEWNTPDWDILRVANCYGICSDCVGELI